MTEREGAAPKGEPAHLDDETISARARALSSPVRWRVLRACLDEALTNKELADLLGVNPGSMLHHVRTLVGTGFLAPGETRRGARNAIEIPYRTTDLVWAAGRSSAGRSTRALRRGRRRAEVTSGAAAGTHPAPAPGRR